MNLTARVALALAVVWALAGTGILLLRKATPTAENVASLIEEHPLEGRTAGERRALIEEVAAQLNALELEERQKLRRSRVPGRYFESMTDEERRLFLDRTLPSGFQQMMEAFNKMEPAKRKQMVRRALEGMERDEERRPPGMDEAMTQKIVDQGLRSFYNDASAETKLDLAPLIERMQGRMQRLER